MDLFSLGNLYPSDFLNDTEKPRCSPVELRLQWDSTIGAARLSRMISPEFMYGRYWYRSGTNQTMTEELSNIVDSILHIKNMSDGDVWLDIACNDGTLLKFVPKTLYRVGIDPADNSFVEESKKHADVIVQDFFSKDVYPKGINRAKVVTCIAMFYDLEDPRPFLSDVHDVMADDGVFILQMSYTPLMLAQTAFDNICHEHMYYYSLESLNKILKECGFRVMDCQLNDTNGGSFRVYAMKRSGNETTFATQPYRDVCQFRRESILALEFINNVNTPESWMEFFKEVENLKDQTVSFIKDVRSKGKSVWCYGASTKGNTLLQYFGLDKTLIDAIAERSPYKVGLRTVGTDIPIKSEKEMRQVKPDYMLVLPWHFRAEFIEREQEYLANGGSFIFPCPRFDVVSK